VLEGRLSLIYILKVWPSRCVPIQLTDLWVNGSSGLGFLKVVLRVFEAKRMMIAGGCLGSFLVGFVLFTRKHLVISLFDVGMFFASIIALTICAVFSLVV